MKLEPAVIRQPLQVGGQPPVERAPAQFEPRRHFVNGEIAAHTLLSVRRTVGFGAAMVIRCADGDNAPRTRKRTPLCDFESCDRRDV